MERSATPPPGAGVAGDAYLGAWRIHPTRILLRHPKAGAQKFLLFPPPGLTGQARLGVITPGGREEFARVWTDGETSPLLFSVPLTADEAGGTVRADLLLETQTAAGQSPPPEAGTRPESAQAPALSGTLDFAPAPAGAKIDFCPLLAPPSAQPGAENTRLLEAALHALEHGKSLRAAWASDWAAQIIAAGLAPRVHALAGEGRLEILATGRCKPETLDALRLPVPLRTGWLPVEGGVREPRELPAQIRPLILPTLGSAPERVDEGHGMGATLGPPLWMTAQGREFLVHGYAPDLDLRSLEPMEGAAAAERFDALLRRSLHWRSGPADRRRPQALGFLPLVLHDAQAWKDARGFAARWNRRHLSPQLVYATPSDYFTAVEELEGGGAVRLLGGLRRVRPEDDT